MPIDAHSSEFARLITAWLDETATAQEATQLWQAIAESPACAREFAAAARFESLLAATLKEQAAEKAVLMQVATMPFKTDRLIKTSAVARLKSQQWPSLLRAAAVATFLGLATWLLWPNAEAPQVAQSLSPKPKVATIVSHLASPPMQQLPMVRPVTAAGIPAAPEKPLLERLDQFFLAGVTLNRVPLHEALGILQGQLQELNFLNAEALKKLRVTVPTDAAGRRITFQSGPIAFLKAVRAIAALGGCEVTIDEATLALILHREIFPQLPERRDVRNILAGRTNPDGSNAADDPERVANLMADAASLGIAIDPNRPMKSQTSVPITRGQWTALQMLTDSHEQLRQLPGSTYQLYISNGQPNQMNQIIDEKSVPEMRNHFQRTGIAPAAVIRPFAGTGSQAPTLPHINVQPLGEVTKLIVSIPSGPNMNRADTPIHRDEAPILIAGFMTTGQGAILSLDAIVNYGGTQLAGNNFLDGGEVRIAYGGQVFKLGSLQPGDIAGRIILLPTNNASQP